MVLSITLLITIGFIVGFGLLLTFFSGISLSTLLASIYIMSIFAVYSGLLDDSIMYMILIVNILFTFYSLYQSRKEGV